MKMFKIKIEVGFSDLISFIAVIISTIALWQSCEALKPYLVIGAGNYQIGKISDEKSGKCQVVVDLPTILNNSGKKATVIKRISLGEDIPIARFSLKDQMIDDGDIKYELYLLKENMKHIQYWNLIKEKNKPINIKLPFSPQIIIPPNSSYTLNFVLSAEVFEKSVQIADRIYIGLDIEDDNRKIYPLRSSFILPEITNGTCQ